MRLEIHQSEFTNHVVTVWQRDTHELTRLLIEPTDENIAFWEQVVRRLKVLRRAEKDEQRKR